MSFRFRSSRRGSEKRDELRSWDTSGNSCVYSTVSFCLSLWDACRRKFFIHHLYLAALRYGWLSDSYIFPHIGDFHEIGSFCSDCACAVRLGPLAVRQSSRRHLLQLPAGMGRLGLDAQGHQGRSQLRHPARQQEFGQALAQILAEKSNPVGDIGYFGVNFGIKAKAQDALEPYKPAKWDECRPG